MSLHDTNHTESPKVSVIISVYNGAQYLRQAIDSILNQTFEDFELIIIDDGSSDESNAILKSYINNRIILIRNENNQGLAKSLNHGLSIAKGEFIARQDADDISDPQRFAKQVLFLDDHPEIAVVGSTTQWIDERNNFLLIWRQPTDNKQIQISLLYTCCLIHGSVMFRSRVIRDEGGYNERLRTGQDYDLWLRISETHNLACLPDVLYMYRRHSNMISLKREQEQKNFVQDALSRAVKRREQYSWIALGLKKETIPPQLLLMSRRQLSQRYTWWSSGARAISKILAYKFLLIALILDPTTPDIWLFIRDVILNKIDKLRTYS